MADMDLFPTATGPAPVHRSRVCYLRVAVERGIDRAGRGQSRGNSGGPGGGTGGGRAALTYWSDREVSIGERVAVPLGRGDTRTEGIVVAVGGEELAAGFPLDRIKPIIDADRGAAAVLPPPLVRLAEWIADYYVCPLGMVMASMMPAAVKRGTGTKHIGVVDLSPELPPEPPKLAPTAREAWERIREIDHGAFPMPPRDLADRIGQRTLGPINRLVAARLLVEGEVSVVEARGGNAAGTASERPGGLLATGRPPPPLTEDQRRIVEEVLATQALAHAAGRSDFAVHLLRGVTGSGKTEVYLRLIVDVLGRGRGAIVLVPEIALTPQTSARFIERFGSHGVAVLHSGLSASQRHAQWRRVAHGKARVVVGARSAVFAPMDNLGLIVVDEEHDSSYKQDQLPRYHARDVAIKRAQLEGAFVLLGSATPSLESWANATDQSPRYVLHELTSRVGGATMPRVEVVDLAVERREALRLLAAEGSLRRGERPEPPQIGPTLGVALRETLLAGGQAILLLNRRGYASYICCSSRAACGLVLQCDQCDAAMVYHRRRPVEPGGYIRCHHCLSEQLLPAACPACGEKIATLGAGTQRIEEELTHRFGDLLGAAPPASPPSDTDNPSAAAWPGLLRVDSDTMRSAGDYFSALERFAAGEVRILLGTQMIAKGLDFPNVRLVGVVNADTAASLPDFRAAERTFQLVSQVAGRAGRGAEPGRVIVQTVCPDMPAIRLAAAHDFRGFADLELSGRHSSGLPPTARMARIVVRDTDAAQARSRAAVVAVALREAASRAGLHLSVIGPAECAIFRISGHYRWSIELTARQRSVIQRVLRAVREEGMLTSDARTAVDVDPVSLM